MVVRPLDVPGDKFMLTQKNLDPSLSASSRSKSKDRILYGNTDKSWH